MSHVRFPAFCAGYLCKRLLPGGGGVLKKVLYGEAPPRGPTPYPFIYHFFRKGTPFVYLGKRHPFHIPSYE